MPETQLLQTNFSSGELDPGMWGRMDTSAYQNGAKALLNGALLNTGGVTRRQGFYFFSAVFGTTPTRIIPFDYDESARYVIGLQDSAAVVVDLTSGAILATLTAPWTAAQLFDLRFTQKGNALVITHQAFMTRVINRISNASWTIGTLAFETATTGNKVYQPYYKFEAPSTRLKLSALTGSGVTMTASSGFFVAAHVGTRFKFFNDAEVLVTGVTSSTIATVTVNGRVQGQLIPNAFKTRIGSSLIEVTHIGHGLTNGASVTFMDALDISMVTYSGVGAASTQVFVAANLNGARTITVIDDDTYSFPVGGGAAATATTDGGGPNIRFDPTNLYISSWTEQVFSDVRGYARACVHHEQRLWLAGSTSLPEGIWSSQISRYGNFDVGAGNDAESIQATVGSGEGSGVQHMVSNKFLQIFTGTREYYCIPSQNSTLTPGTFRVLPQTAYGVSRLRPIPFDGASIFVQANGKTVREYNFDYMTNGYTSNHVSLLSGHLIKQPYDVAVLRGTTQRGEQYLFLLNADHTLAVFNSARSEKLAAWVPWTVRSGDTLYSVCAVGTNLYACVLRNGTYFLELMAPDDSLTLDSATNYSGASASVWTVDARYNGQSVKVNSGDMHLGTYTVAGNAVDLGSNSVAAITVGYDYPIAWETLPPPVVQTPRGNRAGNLQRIAEAFIDLNASLALRLNNQLMILRQASTDVSASPARITGIKRFTFSGYSRQPTLTMTQDEPLPLQVLSIKTKVIC